MKVSLNWLKTFVDISDLTPEAIANRLTFAGVEVESIERLANATNLVIGQVKTCENMPESDHLHLVTVYCGPKFGTLNIVCGAPNVRKDLKVIVALDGAVLPGGTIKKGIIRGHESNGMLCSLAELGVDKKFLKDEQINGIEEVKYDVEIGREDVLSVFGLDDIIFDLKLLANRSDLYAMINFAKEIETLFDKKANIPEQPSFKEQKNDFKVLTLTEKCNQFSGKLIKGIETKDSPEWMKKVLTSSGIRSINNIVDIGNYIMLLTGQPLHMYDYDKLAAKELVVRDDIEGDFVALDEKTYKLQKGDVCITSNGKVMCLGGVMGSLECAVDENTRNIVVEAANFDFASIRRTSTRLNLVSDSSQRFVKGINPNQYNYVMALTTDLLVKLANAKEIYETNTIVTNKYENLVLKSSVSAINGRLGTSFSEDVIISTLEKAYLKINKTKNGEFDVVVPCHRIDIMNNADLSEEVIRILGFENIKSVQPTLPVVTGKLDENIAKKRVARDYLRNVGLDEQITYSLIRKEEVESFTSLNSEEALFVMHPLTDEHQYIRTNVLPSLINALKYNINHGSNDLAFFEVSDVFSSASKQIHLGIVLNGRESYQGLLKRNDYTFYNMKGLLEGLLNEFSIDPSRYSFVENTFEGYHPYKSSILKVQGKNVAIFGELHPTLLKNLGLEDYNPIVCEVRLDILFGFQTGLKKMNSISKFPNIKRDLAFVIDKNVKSLDIVKEIKSVDRTYIKNIDIFDVYTGEHVCEGKMSIAATIEYSSLEKTLNAEEISSIESKIIAQLEKKFNAELRK